MKHFSFGLIVILVITALLSGCQSEQPSNSENITGSSPAEQSESNNTDSAAVPEPRSDIIEPGQLITKADARELLGEDVLDCAKTENTVVGQKLCFYEAADENSMQFLQIGITQQAFMPEDSANTPESIYTTTKDLFGEDAIMIDGIGDETILVTGGYYTLYHGYLLQISAGNIDNEDVLAILNKAGSLAVANLKAILGQ